MTNNAMRQPATLSRTRALISGGTSGVGMATALRLAREGAPRIVLVGRDVERGMAARDLVETSGNRSKVLFLAGDAARAEDSTRVVDAAAAFLGGSIDLLVSAVAPRGHLGPLVTQDAHEVERILTGLTLPVVQINRAALRFMQDAGGTIINVASDAGKVPTPGESVVGGAMAAIAMFSRTLALEVKRYGVRVHAVAPSLIAGTPTADRLMAQEFGAKIFQKIIDKASLGVPDADDVAATIIWLASPEAAKVTGQVISVNGGISAG